jgi:predicted amidohydrolase YtcJ
MQILYNARVYTQDPAQPHVTALAIDQERVLAAGDDYTILRRYADIASLKRSGSPLNLRGRTILPGLTDAHLHLQQVALALQKVDCETTSKAECLRRVAERARSTPPGEWILGHGWTQHEWLDLSESLGEVRPFPSAAELDACAPEHPVFLTAKSLHAAWANTAALRAAGIGARTPDPAGGRLERDAQGEPTGILLENAMGLIYAVLPEPPPEKVAEAIRAAQPRLWRMGLTGLHDFDRRTCFMALQRLHDAGQLRLRVVKSLPLEDLPAAAALGLRSGFGDDWLRIGSVKGFADGALGPRTAAMLQPYEGEPENSGMLLLDAETLCDQGRLAVENGLSLAVHAIGDRANHAVLDAFEQLRALERAAAGGAPGQPLRHRIEHVQIIHPADLPRLAQLGVIASMQPIHATSDFLAADRSWGARAISAYAWRSLLDQGTHLAFGSDAPVESPNPFWGLHAAVTRRRADGSPGADGWYPEQRLSLAEALAGYTTGPAFAAGQEGCLGRLAPGYYADLILLEQDPFTCPPEQLRSLAPLGTMIGGNWVFHSQ